MDIASGRAHASESHCEGGRPDAPRARIPASLAQRRSRSDRRRSHCAGDRSPSLATHAAPVVRRRDHLRARSAAAAARGPRPAQHPITTQSPLAQRYFDQGLNLCFGFNHEAAIRAFEEALEIDPSCAMCEWGIAFALGPNINAPMAPESPAARVRRRAARAGESRASERARAGLHPRGRDALCGGAARRPQRARSRLCRRDAPRAPGRPVRTPTPRRCSPRR